MLPSESTPIKLTGKPLDTLAIPVLFISLVGLLLAFRFHAKQTQAAAPANACINWISPEAYKKISENPSLDNRQLVLYDYTASWCPPCKKLERTVFRNPDVIKDVNTNFIPVRVDISTEADMEKPEVKKLVEKNDVSSIPRMIITLRSGENIHEDRFRMFEEFPEFLEDGKKEAENARAELAYAKGDYVEAIKHVGPERLQGTKPTSPYRSSTYIMSVHLLRKLNRQAEIEPMMNKTLESTKNWGMYRNSSYKPDWLKDLNDYLRGKLTDEDLLLKAGNGSSGKYAAYMAIGLDKQAKGENEKAIKALREAKVYAAKSYMDYSNLANYILREIDK